MEGRREKWEGVRERRRKGGERSKEMQKGGRDGWRK